MNVHAATASLESLAGEAKISLQQSAIKVIQFTRERSEHLSTLVGQPGYGEAFAAEGRRIAVFAGIQAVHSADQLDAAAHTRVFGFLLGLLAAGA